MHIKYHCKLNRLPLLTPSFSPVLVGMESPSAPVRAFAATPAGRGSLRRVAHNVRGALTAGLSIPKIGGHLLESLDSNSIFAGPAPSLHAKPRRSCLIPRSCPSARSFPYETAPAAPPPLSARAFWMRMLRYPVYLGRRIAGYRTGCESMPARPNNRRKPNRH